MPTKEELERLPLGWLAGRCRQIFHADDASFPVATREEARKLYEEYLAIQVENRTRLRRGETRIDINYKTREADLKTRTIAFLRRT